MVSDMTTSTAEPQEWRDELRATIDVARHPSRYERARLLIAAGDLADAVERALALCDSVHGAPLAPSEVRDAIYGRRR